MKAPELTATGVLALAGVVVGGFVLWRFYKAAGQVGDKISDAARAAAEVAYHTATVDLNPADPGNVVNRAVLAVPRAVTGDDSWTLGGWLYEVTHPSVTAMDRPAPGQSYDPMTGLPVG